MNYERPELLDRLAAEYVLGTLEGAARRRFERLLRTSQPAQLAVAAWQARLAGLAHRLDEVAPPATVWQALDRHINPEPQPESSWLVRAWAVLTSVATVVLLGVVLLSEAPPAAEQQVAFVDPDSSTPLWLISVDLVSGELTTTAVSAQAAELDQVYQLWMLPADGDPQSLGLLPVNGGTAQQTFSPALLELIKAAQGLAVSVEPAGGSPTGLPTGPVVYQAQLYEL